MKHNLLRNKVTQAAAAMMVVAAVSGSVYPVVPAYGADRAVEQVYLGEPAQVWWETDTVGRWNSVSKAREYQVKLFIADNIDRDEDDWQSIDWDDEELVAVMTRRTTETSCDFTPYMSDLHSYFFVVRATPRQNQQAYVTAGGWVASPTLEYRGTAAIGITDGRWRNYLAGTMYEDAEQNLLSNGWYLIGGTWYLFDADGYVQTGWQTVDGSRYYLSETGAMATGWFVYQDNWYYADKNGVMQTGWIMDQPGKYYYLNEDGTMASDTTVDGYWLDADGMRRS